MIHSILADAMKECKTAFESEYWKTWGKHYYRSLRCMIFYEYCGNFRDKTPQEFAGRYFRYLQTRLNNVFNKQISSTTMTTYQPETARALTLASAPASTFNNPKTACLHGDGLVLMENNNELKKVKDIRVGDLIHLPNGAYAEITHVVRFIVNAEIDMVEYGVNRLLITLWHPVYEDNMKGGQWIFPNESHVGKTKKMFVDYTYNFVVGYDHRIIVNDVPCITLGHNIIDEEILKHDFYGSNAVIDELDRLYKDDDNIITVEFVRRNADGKSIGFIQKPANECFQLK